MDPDKDILVEIPDFHLPKLASLYEKHAQNAPYMVSFVNMGIKWKQNAKSKNSLIFTSPGNTWETDGTIIAIMTCHCQDIYMFSINDAHSEILYNGLAQTKRIDFDKGAQFFAMHEKYRPIVIKLIQSKKLKVTYQLHGFMLGLPPEKAKTLRTECPPDVYIKKLDVSASKRMGELYPHQFPAVEQFLAHFIETNGGYGVYLRSNDQLVAWVLRHSTENVGVLQVEEGFQRRGYARLVVAALVEEIAGEGYWSTATTITDSVGYKTLTSFGFGVVHEAVYIRVVQNK